MKFELHFLVVPFLTFLAMILGKHFTQQGMTWYQYQIKPFFTPPSWVFMVAWNFIFLCFLVSFILFFKRVKRDHFFKFIIFLYSVSLASNALWSYLYFVKNLTMCALLDAVLLTVIIWFLIIILWKRVRISALLLVPYGLWLLFALYLNYQILILN